MAASLLLAASVAVGCSTNSTRSIDSVRATAQEPAATAPQLPGEDPGAPAEEPSFWDQLVDPEDGQFDVTQLIANGQGFIPIVMPVTEPAVGYGAAGALVYIHPQSDEDREKRVPPSISIGGGAITDNGTWAGFLAHRGIWDDGRIRYFGAAFYADANLTFYPPGTSNISGFGWNAKAAGTIQDLKGQIAENLFLGGEYMFVSTQNSVSGTSAIPPAQLDSKLGGAALHMSFDNRDNQFTANSGYYTKVAGRLYRDFLGSDFDYEQLDLYAFAYWDLEPFVIGARIETHATASGAPFYGLPYLRMRGVPAYRYIGRFTALGEIEPRWKISRRWSLLGFVSAGKAAIDVDDFGSSDLIVAGGGGFRYLMAKGLGLGVGIDLAVGPEDTALYFIFGSYWMGL